MSNVHRTSSAVPALRPLTRGMARALLGTCILVMATVGCGEKKEEAQQAPPPANDCNAVGERLATVTAEKFSDLEGRKKKIMQTQLQLVREKFISTCEREKWTDDIRSCMVAAGDVASFNACTAPLRKARGLPPPAGTAPTPGAAPGAKPMPGAKPAPVRPPAEPPPPPASPGHGK